MPLRKYPQGGKITSALLQDPFLNKIAGLAPGEGTPLSCSPPSPLRVGERHPPPSQAQARGCLIMHKTSLSYKRKLGASMHATAAHILCILRVMFLQFSLPSSHGELSGGTTFEVCAEPRSDDRQGVICELFYCSLNTQFPSAFWKSYDNSSTQACYQRQDNVSRLYITTYAVWTWKSQARNSSVSYSSALLEEEKKIVNVKCRRFLIFPLTELRDDDCVLGPTCCSAFCPRCPCGFRACIHLANIGKVGLLCARPCAR